MPRWIQRIWNRSTSTFQTIIAWLISHHSRWTATQCSNCSILFKAALPNLKHSLSNIQSDENNVVKLTVQLSGTNSGYLDLRKMGIGVVPRSRKFIIFPNGNYEFTIQKEKITTVRDVSPVSPNRRMSGMLKALGVNIAAM